jgi:hypothetical protein
MTIGEARLWSDVFPEDLVPRIIDLVWETWLTIPKPAANDLEVPITRRFKHVLKQAKDYRRLPVRIEREPPEDDPRSGVELGRIDLKFVPAESALEEVYFAFECKRLNVIEDGRRRTLAPKYVGEGMMRFVTGQYGRAVLHGGMIGYVLDGRCDHAIGLVEKNVEARRSDLRIPAGAALRPSSLRPHLRQVRESTHSLEQREFRLHHVFLEGTGIAHGAVDDDLNGD